MIFGLRAPEKRTCPSKMNVGTAEIPQAIAICASRRTTSVPSVLSMKALARSFAMPDSVAISTKDVDVADILPLREIGSEQRLDHRILHAFLLRQPDQPVRVEGVGRSSNEVMTKCYSGGHSGLSDLSIERLRIIPGAKFLRAILIAVHALFGHLGIELESRPSDLQLQLWTEHLKCLFEIPLGHKAPWTNDVGNDDQVMRSHRLRYDLPLTLLRRRPADLWATNSAIFYRVLHHTDLLRRFHR